MKTLQEALTQAGWPAPRRKDPAWDLRAVGVTAEHGSETSRRSWPGTQRHVEFWVELESGDAVGVNIRPGYVSRLVYARLFFLCAFLGVEGNPDGRALTLIVRSPVFRYARRRVEACLAAAGVAVWLTSREPVLLLAVPPGARALAHAEDIEVWSLDRGPGWEWLKEIWKITEEQA